MSEQRPDRRRALRALGAAALWPVAARLMAQATPPADFCANGTLFDTALPAAGAGGYMGYYPIVAGRAFTLRAAETSGGPMPLAYTLAEGGRDWRNPILVGESGSEVRAMLDNALDAPTIVHWHGLQIDSVNDGNGDVLAAPGARFDYAFRLRNRAGLYWYHPHPHGVTAGQLHRGLYGALLVDDPEDRALGTALATVRGESDLVLVLSDRRIAARRDYAPSDVDREAGYVGDEMLVNGVPRAWIDVATRGYRLRVLNASNARTFRLALRGDDGSLLPMTLLGTDGGLLARPVACRELFLATAERADLWVDFAARAIGDSVVLESLAFDPMHGEGHAGAHATSPASDARASTAQPGTHAAHDTAAAPSPQADASVAHPHGEGAAQSTIGDGARVSLLQFRVRRRVAATPAPPPVLSSLAAPRTGSDDAVAFRLSFAKSRWRINDRVFDMHGEPMLVARNSVQTWLLRNYYTSMPHAMHLHGFAMRVLSRETSPDFVAALAIDANGRLPTDLGVKDTVLVWPGESVRVSIDFACEFPGPQDYLLHCHNLEHEDGGMMLRVRVT